MPPNHAKAWLLVVALAAGMAPPAHADACLDFKWDVSQERALYAKTPVQVRAGTAAKSAPLIVPNRLYALRLASQAQVSFSAMPGKRVPLDPAYAGLATLKIPAAGSYRISIDLPLWIDVVSNGELLPPQDFQGQRACSAPHKIVEFELRGAQTFVLQFSSALTDRVLLTVTPTPARKF